MKVSVEIQSSVTPGPPRAGVTVLESCSSWKLGAVQVWRLRNAALWMNGLVSSES